MPKILTALSTCTFLGFALACGSGGPASTASSSPTSREYEAAYHSLERMLAMRKIIGDDWLAVEAIAYVQEYMAPPLPTVGLQAQEALHGFTLEQVRCFADAVRLPEFFVCGLKAKDVPLPPLWPSAPGQIECTDGAVRETVELRNGNRSERCVYSDGKKHGLVAEWTPEGQLVEVEEVDGTRKVGIVVAFHDNGQIAHITDHSDSDRFSVHFHDNGQVSFLSFRPGHVPRYRSVGVLEHSFTADGAYERGNCLVFRKGARLGSGIEHSSAWVSTNREEVQSRPCP